MKRWPIYHFFPIRPSNDEVVVAVNKLGTSLLAHVQLCGTLYGRPCFDCKRIPCSDLGGRVYSNGLHFLGLY